MNPARKTVLIGGGTGFIGTHLCNILRAKRYNIKIISRMPGHNHMSWNQLQDSGLPENTCAVVNLAGQNVLDPTRRWTPGFKQNVWNSRVKTTLALAEAITKAAKPPSVFVSMSGVGIYQPNSETTYTEEHAPLVEFDFLSKLSLEWEKAAQLTSSIECRQVIIRSGVVLGRLGGMIKQMYLPFYLGLGGPIGSGDQYLPWIHIGDTVRLITFAIETDGLKGVLNGVAPQQITNREFTQAFARALGRPAFIPIPTIFLNLIFNEERAKMITEGQRVVPKRTQALGFKYLYANIDEACQELVNSPMQVSSLQ